MTSERCAILGNKGCIPVEANMRRNTSHQQQRKKETNRVSEPTSLSGSPVQRQLLKCIYTKHAAQTAQRFTNHTAFQTSSPSGLTGNQESWAIFSAHLGSKTCLPLKATYLTVSSTLALFPVTSEGGKDDSIYTYSRPFAVCHTTIESTFDLRLLCITITSINPQSCVKPHKIFPR